MILNMLLTVSLVVTFYMLCMTLSNALFLFLETKNPKKTPQADEIKVSVLIPARNEETNIANCLNSFVDQTHSNYEVIVLDDNSTDKTSEIAESFKNKIKNLKILKGKPLPECWHGKQFACHQMAQISTGEILLFIDADTVHQKNSIEFTLTNLLHHKADFLSGFPRQQIYSFGEAIVVPLLFLLMTLVQPLWFLKKSKHGFAAIGQFIAIKRDVYFDIGGYESVKAVVNDDLHIAGLVKKSGYSTIFLDLQHFVSTRMYTDFVSSFYGIAKSVYPAIGNNTIFALLLPLFPLIIALIPIGMLFYSFFLNSINPLAVMQVSFMSFNMIILMISRKLPLASFLYPLTYSVLGFMGWYCVLRSKRGYKWRGRFVGDK